MNLLPPSDVDAPPNAEWHSGVAEHEIKARGVSQGDKSHSLPAKREKKQSTFLAVLLWLALWSLLLMPQLSGHVLIADDLEAYHLPLRTIYQASLQQGENWTWCPWIFSGYHVHGEGQIGGDHPLHQLLYRTLPLHWAFGLECWWAYPATFFGMWWWLRQLRFSTAASQVAGLALSLCGFMTLRVVHVNAVQVIAHLPWLLGCLTWLEHRARHATSLRSLLPPIACSALLTGSQLLLGYPQYVVFTLIAEIVWMCSLTMRTTRHAARPLSTKSKTDAEYASRRKHAWIIVCSWITAKTLGLLLGASQVLPTLEYLSLSERVNWSTEQMFEGSWPLLNLTQLVAPYLFKTRVVGQNTHELTIYMGSVTVCLAVLGLVNRPRRSLRAAKGFALVLCAVGLLLALGDMSPFSAIMPYIPVWNQFRFPCRATLLLCLGIALHAALGWQRLCMLARNFQTKKRIRSTAVTFSCSERRSLTLLIAISCSLPFYSTMVWPEYASNWMALLVAPLIMFCALGLLFIAVRCGPHARNLLPILLCFDLWLYTGTTSAWQQRQKTVLIPLPKLQENRSDWHVPGGIGPRTKGLTDSLEELRSRGQTSLYEAAFNLNGFNATHTRINGYAGVKPKKYLLYDHYNSSIMAGIDEVYSPRPLYAKHERSDRYQCTNSLPRGTLITETEIGKDWNEQLTRLDPHRKALTETAVPLAAPAATDRLQLKLTADRPGRLAFALETNRNALLVTTESFHPGWHARIDGVEMPVLRVNGDFLGVRVPPAARQVECYFSDNSHAVGRWLSLGSLGLLGLVFCLTRWGVARAACPRRI